MRPFLYRFFAIVGVLLLALFCSAFAGAQYFRSPGATLIVTSTNDNGPGTLRDTIAAANDGDTIQFDSALNGQTITLTTGELVIDRNITISGPGPNLLTVSALFIPKFLFRVFHVSPGHIVTIAGLTISEGYANGSVGGGILNDHSTLSLNNCTISGNHTDRQGAGIYNDGSGSSAALTILNSTISGNSAFSTQALVAGGGIANDGSNGGSVTLTIADSLMTGNSAEFDRPQGGPFEGNGGGIYNNGASATLAITNTIVTNNRAGPGSSGNAGNGGGVWNSGAATIMDSTVNGNVAGFGGGVSNSSMLTITGSTVNNNIAAGYHVMFGIYFGDGGGVDSTNGDLTITNTTLSGNRCPVNGGAVHGAGIITNCTISDNQASVTGLGGGISGGLSVTNCTISGNSGNFGGGIYGGVAVTNCTISGNQASTGGGGIAGSPTVTNCTISGNNADNAAFGGGGIYGGGIIRHSTITGNTGSGGGGIAATGPLEIGNTVLKTGTSGANIVNNGGAVTSHGYNISNDNGGGFLTGPGDQINTDPMLGLLQNNGGPTFTHALLPGSPAIDAGDPNFTPPPFTDQRGNLRVYNGRIDIGSFEVQPPPITISGNTAYCSNPELDPVPNVTLTVTGSASTTTFSDSSGNYMFSVPSGGSYTVTPGKVPVTPSTFAINTIDVVAVQRHFLNIGAPLSGCRLLAADVNGDSLVNTVDVTAIQRFVLALPTGTANVGNYQFTPPSRTYQGVVTNQTNQNYDTLVFGDVATPYVH